MSFVESPGPELSDPPGSAPIERVRWAHHIPAQRMVGPGSIVTVELRAGDHVGFGYAHVAYPKVVAIAAAIGLACTRRVLGSTPGVWQDTRDDLLRRSLVDVGARGLGGVVVGALDLAMWDLSCRQRGVSIEELLGRSGPADCYSCEGLLPGTAVRDCGLAADALAAAGIAAVKVYVVGNDLAQERDRLATVRSAIGPERHLYVDAGGVHEAQAARRVLELAAEHDVEWVEDPTDPADLDAWARLAQDSPVALAGGQSASAVELDALLDAVPLRMTLVDLQQVGGISGWLAAERVAAAHGVAVSSHAYTHVGVRLLAGARRPGAVVQHAPWDDDVLGPVPVRDGRAVPPETLGATPAPVVELVWQDAR